MYVVACQSAVNVVVYRIVYELDEGLSKCCLSKEAFECPLAWLKVLRKRCPVILPCGKALIQVVDFVDFLRCKWWSIRSPFRRIVPYLQFVECLSNRRKLFRYVG